MQLLKYWNMRKYDLFSWKKTELKDKFDFNNCKGKALKAVLFIYSFYEINLRINFVN